MSAGSINPAANQIQSPQRNAFADISSSQFTQIMTAELSNQDPLNPSDSRAILDQIASLMNIESQSTLQSSLEDLVSQNSIASAASLIGGVVRGLDASGNEIEGVVASVRVVNDEATYVLEDGRRIAVDDVLDLARPDEGGGDGRGAIDEALLASATELIGRRVAGADDNGNAFAGEVKGVRSTDAGVELELDDATRIRPAWVTAVGEVTS